ncbi:MAG: sulfatase-like hydrolase/transferase, partial [Planctomycetota bacterium]
MKRLFVCLFLVGVSYAATKPNIVLIMVDDMGYSDIGCYGSEILTPNLDTLAANGIRFREFYNTAKCFPTRACLIAGIYAHQTGTKGNDNGFADTNATNLKNSVTLGEVLGAAGYHTYASGKHHSFDNLYDRGFDHYYGLRDGACNHFNPGLQRAGEEEPARKTGFNRQWVDDGLRFDARDPAYQSYFTEIGQDPNGNDRYSFYSTDAFTAKAQEYLTEWETQNTGDPFFLYLAYTAPHDPIMAWPEDIVKYDGIYDVGYDTIRNARYQKQKDIGLLTEDQHELSPSTYVQSWSSLPQAEKDKEARRMQVYAAMIDCVDQRIGDLITQLQQMGVYDDTLILFCSDNGASPGIKDSQTNPDAVIGDLDRYTAQGQSWANVNDTPFREYKTDPEEGGIRSPLIAHWPNGIVNPGRFTDKTAHLIDFMSTFVDITGADYPRFYDGTGVTPMQGVSFADVLYDQTVTRNKPLYFEYGAGRVVRDGDYKLITNDGGSTWKLFDMSTDATELNDLSASLPSVKSDLLAQYNTWWSAVNLNDLPTAYDDSAVAAYPGSVDIDVLSNDVDSDGTIDASTLVITRAPTNGTAVIRPDDTIRYTASEGFSSDEFFYQIRDNDGEVSNEGRVAIVSPDSIPPAPPAGLFCLLGKDSGNDSVSLGWTDNTEPDMDFYKIKRSSVSGGPYQEEGQSSTSDYIDSPVANPETYYYVVTAVDVSGNESSSSNEETVLPVYQAEDAAVVGPEIKSSQPGYTGTGYADYKNASDDYIEWTVTVASGGDYNLFFRYALGSSDRPLEIKVNGQVVDPSLSFQATGGWTTWSSTAPLSVTLNAGANTVRATAIGFSGGNLDYLAVGGDPPANNAPSFTSPPINKPNATEDKAYSGTIADVASDPEGDPMTFTKEGGPDWLVVDPNGTLSGTPGDSDTNDVPNVFTVQVSATGGSATATLTIEVLNI